MARKFVTKPRKQYTMDLTPLIDVVFLLLIFFMVATTFSKFTAMDIKIPVMLIHGEKDRRFPLAFALELKRSFAAGQAELYVAEGAGHSDSSRTSGYEAATKSFLDRHLKRD